MPQGTGEGSIIVKTVQRLMGSSAGNHAFAPVPGQRRQVIFANTGQPAPITFRNLKQRFDVFVIGTVDEEDEGPRISEVCERSLAVYPAVLLRAVVFQQGLAGSTLAFRVQNQAQRVAER